MELRKLCRVQDSDLNSDLVEITENEAPLAAIRAGEDLVREYIDPDGEMDDDDLITEEEDFYDENGVRYFKSERKLTDEEVESLGGESSVQIEDGEMYYIVALHTLASPVKDLD